MENEASRWWDFPSAILLLLALLTSAERLVSAGWTPSLSSAALLTALGAALGLALGKSRFGHFAASLLAFSYSLFFLPWAIGERLYDSVAWGERLTSMGGRLADSFLLLLNRQPVEDPLLFVTFACIVSWSLSLSSAFSLTRRARFLAAVLPAGITLLLIQLFDPYYPGRIGFLAVYLFLCLILYGRINFLRRRNFWQDQHIKLSSESVTDLNGTMVVAAAALVLLIWLAPSPARPFEAASHLWERATKIWQPLVDDLANAVAGLKRATVGVNYDYYGDTLELGLNAASGDAVIFTAQTPYLKKVARYYWRVRTYDRYEKDAWSDSAPNRKDFLPVESPLILPEANAVEAVEYSFTSNQPLITTLFTPPNPVWFSRPGQLLFTLTSDNNVDPLAFRVDPALHSGETYQVQALDFDPTEKQLRETSTDLPEWVGERYLQIPENLPRRVSDLAQSLTGNQPTAYDKAKAVTSYLRNTIQYTKTMQRTLFGQNRLEWFLFDYKQGYCNYYATAEVILLRAAGVPSRLAVGFAQGEVDINHPDRWSIRLEDAHAWPEVYFPDVGWVQFEPTSAQPMLSRPTGEQTDTGTISPPQSHPEEPEETPPPESSMNSGQPVTHAGYLQGWLFVWAKAMGIGIGSVGILLLLILAWKRFSPHMHLAPLPITLKNGLERLSISPPRWLERWAVIAALTPMEHAYRTVYQSLRRLGAPASPSRTPAEAAALLTGLLPMADDSIRALLHEYEHSLYSQRSGHIHLARGEAKAIRHAATRALFLRKFAALKHAVTFNRG